MIARDGDTSVDDSGTEAEPFRVHIRHNEGWINWAEYATQQEAEDVARSIAAPLHTFHGTTRNRYPLP